MFDFNTSIAYNIEEKSESCISIMALKRKCNNDLRIVLDYATGDRVRATVHGMPGIREKFTQ